MKYLLLLALFGVIWWLWKKRNAAPPPSAHPDPQPERMVVCAHCGLHLPESDSVACGDVFYCCQAHRQAAETKSR
ncbi:MAG: hypothetical protein F9K30_08320 [Dechloromonas sp.]|nr:MAG: hypothetical protein F9K30_08320 [Dechloromonas sp.]